MEMEFTAWLVGGGLTLGLLFGALIQRSKFCMAAAVSNLLLMRDYRQLHATLMAMLVGIVGVYLLSSSGLVDVAESSYRAAQINWLGAVAGGLCFGFGTILAGGCVGRTMVRVGEGNLGALLVLLAIAVMATATSYGPLEPLRMAVYNATAMEAGGSDGSLAALLGVPEAVLVTMVSVMIVAVLLFVGNRSYSLPLMAAGLGIGLLVVAGWLITGYLSQDDFTTHAPSSLAYAGPLARTTTVLASGAELGDGTRFGIALVAGTLIGGLLMALATRSFRWVMPDARNLPSLIVGGLLMGFGAVMAGGCNIGVGLTGISTCSIQPLIAVAAIVAGMGLGLAWVNWLEERRLGQRRPAARQALDNGSGVRQAEQALHYRQLTA